MYENNKEVVLSTNVLFGVQSVYMKQDGLILGMGTGTYATQCSRYLGDMLAKQRPDYITVADTIAASETVTTLLRCTGIKDGDNTKYFLTKEGEQPAHKNIDRVGIAQCMYDNIYELCHL